jgi:asparagine synthase (glutamine-hydrolysing)
VVSNIIIQEDIQFEFSHKWTILETARNNFVAVLGEGWFGGKLYRNNKLAKKLSTYNYFSDIKTQVGCQEVLIPENGNFAYIVVKNNNLFATVDRTRSTPIFYGYTDKQFYISDNARWVRKKLNDIVLDSLSVQEFYHAGYVTGRDTLFPKVKQLQAGEYLCANNGTTGIEVKHKRYYTYLGKDFFKTSINELIPVLDEVFVGAFERLIQSANGRTLVVPLSGGLDSRLIITMFKRLGYEKVIAFSYGKRGNKELRKSKEIASKIDYPWEYIPYTRSLWRNWYYSKEFDNYSSFADSLCSLPHIDDWPAVWMLKEKQIIPEDAIFVPGHTGDFITGGHIPPMYLDCSVMNNEILINSIIKKHYRVNNFKEASKEVQEKIILRIQSRLPNGHINNIEGAGYVFEFFDWQERQAKYIINSLRVYEYWGYDWRIPLWDVEIMNFWQHVPFEYKILKKLYKSYLKQMNFYGTFSDINSDGRLTVLARKSGVFNILKNFKQQSHTHIQRYKKQYLDYFLDDHQNYSIFSYPHVAFKNRGFQSILTFLVYSHIERLRKELTTCDEIVDH